MKRKTLTFTAIMLVASLMLGCSGKADSPADDGAKAKTEVIVFAAASLTETLTGIAEEYSAVQPDVTLTFNFDSSGTLKTQIEEGAACDLFISAAPKQMNGLDGTKTGDANPGGLDMIKSETRVDLLENKVVLAVPENNAKNINSYDDLITLLSAKDVLLAMGNSDVPVGQYTQKILDHFGLDEQELANAGCITYGSNVKEVTTQVSEATVDCGIIYSTDAFSAGLKVVDEATEEMCGKVIYPAAVLKASAHSDEAAAFLEFLKTSDKAHEIFTAVGFTPLT